MARGRGGLGWCTVGAGALALWVAGCSGGKDGSSSDAETDADGDGVPASEDCDDSDATVYPGAEEACDGKDNDCDGATDLADADVVGVESAPIDSDGDGYGEAGRSADFCAGSPPANVADNADDCDDRDDTINPEGNEICDGEDNDCDGLVDGDDPDAVAIPTWAPDVDGDGYGDAAAGFRSCENPGEGYAENALDCDDSDPTIHPEATETCGDGVDADCDGSDGVDRFAGDGELNCAYVLVDGPSGALAAGDVDEDGTAELLVGGDDTLALLGDPLTGVASSQSLGGDGVAAVAVGDLDGDGVVDLVAVSNTAELIVQSGPVEGTPALSSSTSLGAGSAPQGLWVGELGSAGAAVVGRPGSGVSVVQDGLVVDVLADEGLSSLGADLQSVGDVTGDGLAELAIGAPDDDTVLLVADFDDGGFGTVLSLTGEGAFGAAVSGTADVDGDGLDDVLVGAPARGDGDGAVFAMKADGTMFSRMDGATGSAAGTDVDAIGDLNQDGYGDVVVGSPGADGGRVDVIIGPVPEGTTGVLDLVAYQLTADRPTDAAGSAVLGHVDFNSDSYHDFVVSIPGADLTAVFLGVRNW